jgi:two-component system, OmpR family, sensor histidine kinase VicK
MDYSNSQPGFPSNTENKNVNNTIPEAIDFCENAILPLHCVNGSGIITWANKAELDFLGYAREEYLNHHVGAFYVDIPVCEDILNRLAKHQPLVNYYARVRSKSGEIKHVLLNSSAFFKDGKFSHTRCFTTDITELKKAEMRNLCLISELREKNTRLQWQAGNIKRSA